MTVDEALPHAKAFPTVRPVQSAHPITVDELAVHAANVKIAPLAIVDAAPAPPEIAAAQLAAATDRRA